MQHLHPQGARTGCTLLCPNIRAACGCNGETVRSGFASESAPRHIDQVARYRLGDSGFGRCPNPTSAPLMHQNPGSSAKPVPNSGGARGSTTVAFTTI